MEITNIRVRLAMPSETRKGLRAFCAIEIDNELVVNDIKLIEGRKGLFVAMPNRKICDHCRFCKAKTDFSAVYCHACGKRLGKRNPPTDLGGRPRRFADMVHPITPECRLYIQDEIIKAYEDEKAKGG